MAKYNILEDFVISISLFSTHHISRANAFRKSKRVLRNDGDINSDTTISSFKISNAPRNEENYKYLEICVVMQMYDYHIA